MKVLLINPPAENLVRTFAPDSLTEEMGLYPPMGLLYIATYARKIHGDRFQIKILDTQVEKMAYPDIRKYLKQEKPDLVGISCMTFLLIDALKVVRIAKEENPSVHIVIGGTHPTIYPEEMASQPEIDSIVMGEGEVAFSELLDQVAAGQSLANIQGVGYKDRTRVIINPRRDFIQDLDSLPFPDRDLLPVQKYYNVLGESKVVMTSLLTSRGCPFKCTFCTDKDGRACRMRSPENVLQEMEECYAKGITDFDIIDDTFTINKKRAVAIADLIIEKGLSITMDLRARVDTVDQETLDKLAQAGCTRIRFGVESGNPGVLENLQKGITLEQIRSAFRMAKKAGIFTFAYFMLGSPGETEQEIRESLKLAKELNPDVAQFLITTPFPATEMYERGIESGVLKGDYWREFSAHPSGDFVPQWWTENFTQSELEKWQRKVHLRYYYRPAYIWGQLKQVKSLKELIRKARIGIRLFFG
ncbi:MAG: radical SAM protein [Candidatus Aminicenantes bacterium]|nr:radical SAM protein [Candidatus Aminicenantes bacterium]